MPRISQILTTLGIVFSIFVILIVWRYLTLPPVYEFLPKTDEKTKTWTPPEYEVPAEAKG